jgi:hypothetical protein
MNWYSTFYWLTVADSVKKFFDVASNVFTFFAVIFFLIMIITIIGKAIQVSEDSVENEEDEKTNADVRAWEFAKKYSTKLFWPSLIICIITWLGYVMVPTKKDCLLIIAGGSVGNFLTTDKSAKELPGDITKFLHLSLQKEVSDLSEDGRKQIGLQTNKDKLIDKAKKMTKDELVKYLETDSTLSFK